MTRDGASLKVNIHRQSRPFKVVASNADGGFTVNFASDSFGPKGVRTGPQYAFDIGTNELGQKEMRFVYTAAENNFFYIQGGYCTIDLATCVLPKEWRTPAVQGQRLQFHPAIKFGRTDATTGRGIWRMTFMASPAVFTPPSDAGKVAVFTADLVRDPGPANTAAPMTFAQISPSDIPCPDIRSGNGYWGDYDDMGYDPVAQSFMRAFADSTAGCVSRMQFTSTNVHVSLAESSRGARSAAPTTPLAGFQFNGLQEQIKYANTDGHICEMYFTKDFSNWLFNDLTDKIGAPAVSLVGGAATSSRIAAFDSTFNQQQHVVYQSGDINHHLIELVYSNTARSWLPPNDLTSSTPSPKFGSALAAYQTTFNGQNQLHVDFIDNDGFVHELLYTGSWHDTNLHQLLNQTSKPKAVNLVGYITPYNGQQHVTYVGEDHNIYEFMFDTAWHFNTITSNAPVAPDSAFHAYVSTYNTQQHLNFLGNNQHVLELVNTQGSAAWNSNDLNQLAGAAATLVLPSSPLAGYQTIHDNSNQQHVNFIDSNHHIQEFVIGTSFSNWTPFDLTSIAVDVNSNNRDAPHAASGSPLAGFATTWNNQQHVVYTTDLNDVYELFFDTTWHGNNLTKNALRN
jgi:hypothetical protein